MKKLKTIIAIIRIAGKARTLNPRALRYIAHATRQARRENARLDVVESEARWAVIFWKRAQRDTRRPHEYYQPDTGP